MMATLGWSATSSSSSSSSSSASDGGYDGVDDHRVRHLTSMVSISFDGYSGMTT